MKTKLPLHRRPRAKIGAPPGTLIHVGERRSEHTRIRLIAFNGEDLKERELTHAEECLTFRRPAGTLWVNVDGIHDIGVMEEIGRCFDLHPLVLEDILNTEHRPKFEDYESYVFIVMKMLRVDAGQLFTEQISLVLGQDFVLSFQEREGDVFERIRERLRTGKGRIRRSGADYLAYTLMDAVVDGYYLVLEELGERIEELEEEVVSNPLSATLQGIHRFKREIIYLRRSVWPLREVISNLQRSEPPLVQAETQVFLRDVYDHTIQVADTMETYRDIIASLLDLYLSSLSNRMNEVMKVLTIIATIFIPLTFLAGVYGMNFRWMPELRWKWAYPVLWGIMAGIAGGMVLFFRKKKWF